MKLSIEQEDIHALVTETVREFDQLAKSSGLRIDCQFGKEPVMAEVDAHRFCQVIRNLIGNAVKFSPTNSTVQVEVAARLDECRFEIKISDQGPGISEDELELVFDKFVRSSRTRNGAGGTGLGLAISRELTNAHRGEILAGNVFGGGAQFTLCLPCEQKAESADDAQAA